MRYAVLCALVLVMVLQPASGDDSVVALPSADVSDLVHGGAAAYQAGSYKKALKLFRLADEQSNGTSWDAVAGATSTLLQMGKNSNARRYAERLLPMDESPARKGIALYLLGVSLAGLNQLPESEAALRQSLALRSERPLGTRTSLVAVLCRQGKHDEGLALLDDRGMCAQAAEESDDPDNDEPDRFELGGEITEPVKISGDYPKYPEADRLARIEGTVVLDSLIGPDGALQCVRVMDGPSPNMNCSAALAVMNWRFEPARLDGEPVEVFYILSVRFELR